MGIEEIEFVVLLDDVELRGIDKRTEMNRGGIDRGGDVFEMKREQAGGEVDLADVANEGDIGVVDGDGEIDLIFFRGDGGLLARGVFFLRLRDLRLARDFRRAAERRETATANPARIVLCLESGCMGCLLVAETTPRWLERSR